MSIRFKLMLLISLLFVAGIGNAVFTFQLESHQKEKVQWILHTHQVINNTEKLLSSIKDAETGQRGFLLTKTNAYLKPYYTGVLDAKKYFKVLKALTADNQIQQRRLDLIKRSMEFKFTELAVTIELVQKNNGDDSEALALVMQNKGKKHMDDIRSLLSDFNHTEAVLLEQRNSHFREHSAQITTFIIVEIIFFLLLAFITILFLNRNLFTPLEFLVSNIHKMESGKKLDIKAVTANDEMGYLLSIFFNMHKKIYERTKLLTYKAHHDELTGLKNRTNMYDEIQNSINNLKELDSKCAVFFLDLNKFKQLNDTLGHDAGDLILIETATRLKSSVRGDDTLFRVGGDEFVILIKDVKAVSDIQNIAVNILNAFAPVIMIQGQAIEISLSIGIAISPDDTKSSEEIIKFSDVAMYEAKRDKDTNYKFFDRGMLKRFSDT